MSQARGALVESSAWTVAELIKRREANKVDHLARYKPPYSIKPLLKPLANPKIRRLKATAQLLDPILKIGKAGLSGGFVQSVRLE